MKPMSKTAKQKEFLRLTVTSLKSLEEIFEDLKISPQAFVTWLGERDFRGKLHGMRRYLGRARELQLETSSLRAAGILSRLTSVPREQESKPITRAACIDVIRLARDSRVRRHNLRPDEVARQRRVAHPDISDEEATRLMLELETSQAKKGDALAPSDV